MVSESELRTQLRKILSVSDSVTVTPYSVRCKLEKHFGGVDLSDHKPFISEQIDIYFQETEEKEVAEGSENAEVEEAHQNDDVKVEVEQKVEEKRELDQGKSKQRKTSESGKFDISLLPARDYGSLPIDVCQRFVNLLLPKDGMITTLVSKEWKGLRPYLPALKIKFMSDVEGVDVMMLNKFIDNFLRHSMLPLPRFELKCTLFEESRPIVDVINVALERNVTELYLSVAVDDNEDKNGEECFFQLPYSVLSNHFIHSMRLKNVRVIFPIGLKAMVFTSLRKLNVDISSRCSRTLMNFYSACPVLQELTLKGKIDELAEDNDHNTISVNSVSLEILRIELEAKIDYEESGFNETYTFEINAPNLRTISIEEDVLADYQVTTGASITEATLQMGWQSIDDYEYVNLDHVNDVFQPMKGLTNVTSLTLYERTIGFAGNSFHRNSPVNEFPEFPRLTDLTVFISHHFGFDLVLYLLDRTPVLENLVINIVNWNQMKRSAWAAMSTRPACLASTLRSVQINGFGQCGEKELPLIGYLREIKEITGCLFDLIIK